MSQPLPSVSLRHVCLQPHRVTVNEMLRESYVMIYGISTSSFIAVHSLTTVTSYR